jgi:membrane-bound inhibitor of C-type lysozyme
MTHTKYIVGWIIMLVLVVLLLLSVATNLREQKVSNTAHVTNVSGAQDENMQVYLLECSDGFEGRVTYQSRQGVDNVLITSGGQTVMLSRTPSAAGAQHQTEDGRMVFLEKGGLALIQIDGVTVHEDCVLSQ